MRPHGNAFTRFLVTLALLGLAAAVVVLLSELNARTFRLGVEDGRLTVNRGRPLPFGTEPYHPADPALADAYAPLDLRGHSPGTLTEVGFTERDELDRALFGLEESIARPLVMSDRPQDLDQGLALLRRMDRLPGLTQDQRQTLRQLEAEVAYYQARLLLDDARKEVAQAMAQLKLAADGPSRNARSAHQMLSTVEGPAGALEEALRLAVHSLSAPAEEPPAAPAATSPSSPR